MIFFWLLRHIVKHAKAALICCIPVTPNNQAPQDYYISLVFFKAHARDILFLYFFFRTSIATSVRDPCKRKYDVVPLLLNEKACCTMPFYRHPSRCNAIIPPALYYSRTDSFLFGLWCWTCVVCEKTTLQKYCTEEELQSPQEHIYFFYSNRERDFRPFFISKIKKKNIFIPFCRRSNHHYVKLERNFESQKIVNNPSRWHNI